MDVSCGDIFNKQLSDNYTLIDFDYSMNQFALQDSRDIQDKLRRNKKIYDEERLKEWKERKNMRAEDQALRLMYIQEHSSTEKLRMEEEAKEARENELNAKWKKFMLETEIEKQQIIQQLTEAAVLRQSKGKKKKGGKKKKK